MSHFRKITIIKTENSLYCFIISFMACGQGSLLCTASSSVQHVMKKILTRLQELDFFYNRFVALLSISRHISCCMAGIFSKDSHIVLWALLLQPVDHRGIIFICVCTLSQIIQMSKSTGFCGQLLKHSYLINWLFIFWNTSYGFSLLHALI